MDLKLSRVFELTEGFNGEGEALHLKVARLAWRMWMLCAGSVKPICMMLLPEEREKSR